MHLEQCENVDGNINSHPNDYYAIAREVAGGNGGERETVRNTGGSLE